MLVKKYLYLASFVIVSACATSSMNVPPPANIKSELNYEEAYNLITTGSNKCYPRTIVDHDLYKYKQIAEISINTHPWSFFITPVAAESVGSRNMLDVSISGTAGNKSNVYLSDSRYETVITRWLKNDFNCAIN